MGELLPGTVQAITVVAILLASVTAMVFAFPSLFYNLLPVRKLRWFLLKWRISSLLKKADRHTRIREDTRAQEFLEQALALYKRETGMPYMTAKFMLTRADFLAKRFKHREALKAYVDFIKALEFDRGLTRDERQYLLIYAGAQTITVLRRYGHYMLMDELRPLWSADFSRLHDLKVPPRTLLWFRVQPPAVPFAYKPEVMHQTETELR